MDRKKIVMLKINLSPSSRCAIGFALLGVCLILGSEAGAAEKTLRLWNTTAVELDEVRFAAPGTTKWGPNQCLNDDDKTVEADERLDLKGVTPGRYDVKVRDVHGQTCFVKNVEVRKSGKYALAIDHKELTDCTK